MDQSSLIQQAYAAFNLRNIPAILTLLHPQVRWSRAWEGGYAVGHHEVQNYWQEIDPYVDPTAIEELPDGRWTVTVQQVVANKQGQEVFKGVVRHVVTFREGLIQQMDIVQV
jgi:hypothetical protein